MKIVYRHSRLGRHGSPNDCGHDARCAQQDHAERSFLGRERDHCEAKSGDECGGECDECFHDSIPFNVVLGIKDAVASSGHEAVAGRHDLSHVPSRFDAVTDDVPDRPAPRVERFEEPVAVRVIKPPLGFAVDEPREPKADAVLLIVHPVATVADGLYQSLCRLIRANNRRNHARSVGILDGLWRRYVVVGGGVHVVNGSVEAGVFGESRPANHRQCRQFLPRVAKLADPCPRLAVFHRADAVAVNRGPDGQHDQHDGDDNQRLNKGECSFHTRDYTSEDGNKSTKFRITTTGVVSAMFAVLTWLVLIAYSTVIAMAFDKDLM